MTLQQDVDVLRRIPLFAKIEPARLKLLAFTSEHVEFQPGEPVCRQGEPGNSAYIVLDGAADVVVQSERGPMTVAHIGRNDIVGEIAILCDVPRTATVLAKLSWWPYGCRRTVSLTWSPSFPRLASR